MKKKYIVPEMEIIELTIKQPMLLPVSGAGSDTQWAPRMDGDFEDDTEEI